MILNKKKKLDSRQQVKLLQQQLLAKYNRKPTIDEVMAFFNEQSPITSATPNYETRMKSRNVVAQVILIGWK